MVSRLKSRVTSASTEKAGSTFQSGLINGGPAALIYGLLLSWLGSLAVCASLAEMASMYVIEHFLNRCMALIN